MSSSFEKIKSAGELRKRGFSYGEIAKKLSISKSTAFLWTKNIILTLTAKKRLKSKEKFNLIKANQSLKTKRNIEKKYILDSAKLYISKISLDHNLDKLFCSFLYWAEGSKIGRTRIIFTNSDPKMINVFLKLFRRAFIVDEKKFRALIHIHEYHNDSEIKKYWSEITKIPLSQFNRSYFKPHTRKRIRDNYKGTISIRYYDYKIAQEINFIYNILAEKMLGSW